MLTFFFFVTRAQGAQQFHPIRLWPTGVVSVACVARQADVLMNEIDCSIELMVGSSLAPGKDEVRFNQRIADVRAARVVVATAGAFEHAMCKVTVVLLYSRR